MKKIKTITIKFLLLIGLMTLMTSCLNDLSVLPKDDDDFTSEIFYSDPNSYIEFLAKIYAGLAVTGQQGPSGQADIQGIDEGFGQYLRGYWQLQELPTDEAMVAWGDPTLPELNTQSWNADNRFVKAFYARVFYQVGLVNEFLRQTTDAKLDSRGVSEAQKAEIKVFRAEARFLRALSYYHAIDLFGKVAFATEESSVGDNPEEKDRTFVFNYLVDELNAIDADLKPARTNDYGRVDKIAAKMLLAKLYLNSTIFTGVNKDAEALTATNEVIASPYSISNVPYSDLFLADNDRAEVRSEMIFPIRFDGINTKTWGGTTFLVHASTGTWNSEMGVDAGWYGLVCRKEFTNVFKNASGIVDLTGASDKRAIFKSAPLNIPTVSNFFDLGGLKVRKFKNVTSLGTAGSNQTHVDTDFPLFRLADAYLMYAELATKGLGSAQTAVNYINTLRARANATLITSADLSAQFVLDERARELYWEGTRRQDLIRFGKFIDSYNWQWKGGVYGGISVDEKYKLYPIPQSELNSNPNLTQNIGY